MTQDLIALASRKESEKRANAIGARKELESLVGELAKHADRSGCRLGHDECALKNLMKVDLTTADFYTLVSVEKTAKRDLAQVTERAIARIRARERNAVAAVASLEEAIRSNKAEMAQDEEILKGRLRDALRDVTLEFDPKLQAARTPSRMNLALWTVGKWSLVLFPVLMASLARTGKFGVFLGAAMISAIIGYVIVPVVRFLRRILNPLFPNAETKVQRLRQMRVREVEQQHLEMKRVEVDDFHAKRDAETAAQLEARKRELVAAREALPAVEAICSRS